MSEAFELAGPRMESLPMQNIAQVIHEQPATMGSLAAELMDSCASPV